MKDERKAQQTMAIKSRVYNFIRKSLYKKQVGEIFKVEFAEQLFKLHQEADKELFNLKKKRKEKKKVAEARVLRGWMPKKKTSKATFEELKNAGFKAKEKLSA